MIFFGIVLLEVVTQLWLTIPSVGIAAAVPTEASATQASAAARIREIRFIKFPFLKVVPGFSATLPGFPAAAPVA